MKRKKTGKKRKKTEENIGTRRNKQQKRKKWKEKRRKQKTTEKKKGRNRKRHRSGDPFCEIPTEALRWQVLRHGEKKVVAPSWPPPPPLKHSMISFRMRLFCLQLEASCLQWSFLVTVDNFSFFTYSWSFFACSFSFFTYSWSFFAYSGKVRLIRALRDCKQRSLTVSKKTPTASSKASPFRF